MGNLLGVQIWAAIATTVGALAIIFKWGGDLWSWFLSTHRVEDASIDEEAGLNTNLGPAGVQQDHLRLSALRGQRAINLTYPPPVHESGRELDDLPPAAPTAATTAAIPLPTALPPPTAVPHRLNLRYSAEADSGPPAPSNTMAESLARDQVPDQAGNEHVAIYQDGVWTVVSTTDV